MQDLVLQIVNNVAGAGILTLSAGMAAGVGWVPASCLCITLGAISGITFHLIGAACEMTGETTFKGLWDATLGEGSAWLVDLSIALMCLSAAIIYAGILGDTATQLLNLVGLPAQLNVRAINIGLLSIFALTPLSLLDDLSALSFTSLLGVVAVLYTALFIAYRALDGAYALPSIAANGAASSTTGGQFIHSLPKALIPSFSKASRWKMDAKSLILVSNLGLAYIAHYNAPTFYRSLDRPSTKRFGKVCAMAFGVLSLLYLAIMLLGHRTFGDVTAANILRNYAERDPLAVLGRAATFASILFGFPLAMLGLKDSLFSLLTLPDTLMKPATLLLLACVATVAILVTDIGLVVGISGALLGAAIVYIFPALIYGSALRQHEAKLAKKKRKKREEEEGKTHVDGGDPDGSYSVTHHFDKDEEVGLVSFTEVLIYLLVPLGAFLGVLGVVMTLKSA